MYSVLNIQQGVPSLNLVVYQSVRPPLRETLSQGVLAGASASFMLTVLWSFSVDNYYKVLVISALHEFLAVGAVIGLVSGFAVWCGGRFFTARVPLLLRLMIVSLVVVLADAVLTNIYPSPSSEFSVDDYVRIGARTLLLIVSLGLTTGSRLQPLRALSHGLRRQNTHQRFVASLTGVLMGSALLFGFFETALTFICLVEMNEEFFDHLIVGLALGYLSAGIVIILANPRFWLTMTLAIVINAPLVFILIRFLGHIDTFWLFILLGYLGLWCAFLLTHLPFLNRLFRAIGEELRYYYLID